MKYLTIYLMATLLFGTSMKIVFGNPNPLLGLVSSLGMSYILDKGKEKSKKEDPSDRQYVHSGYSPNYSHEALPQYDYQSTYYPYGNYPQTTQYDTNSYNSQNGYTSYYPPASNPYGYQNGQTSYYSQTPQSSNNLYSAYPQFQSATQHYPHNAPQYQSGQYTNGPLGGLPTRYETDQNKYMIPRSQQDQLSGSATHDQPQYPNNYYEQQQNGEDEYNTEIPYTVPETPKPQAVSFQNEQSNQPGYSENLIPPQINLYHEHPTQENPQNGYYKTEKNVENEYLSQANLHLENPKHENQEIPSSIQDTQNPQNVSFQNKSDVQREDTQSSEIKPPSQDNHGIDPRIQEDNQKRDHLINVIPEHENNEDEKTTQDNPRSPKMEKIQSLNPEKRIKDPQAPDEDYDYTYDPEDAPVFLDYFA